MAVIDARERLTKELQFSADAERQIQAAFDTAFEAMNHLHATVKNAFAERQRALAAALGAPSPQPETIEQPAEPARKQPKLVKAAGGES
ncbi:MAG: hypothetical protein ABFD96_05830 [Armatimonadia bacterium]